MLFLSFVALLAIAYLLWRISEQMPDFLYRLSEIQRDIAEIRRRGDDADNDTQTAQADADDDG